MVSIDSMPLYEIQSLYYTLWKEKEEESKMSKEDRAAAAAGRMIEDIT